MYCLSFIISAVRFNTNDMISFILVLLVLVVFFATWAINRISVLRIRNTVRTTKEISTIMQRTLEINHSYVVRLNINEQKALPSTSMATYYPRMASLTKAVTASSTQKTIRPIDDS